MINIDVDTAVTVPVNIMPLTDDTDFITRETGITYNQAGMDLVWNFVTSAGVITQTAVTPTTAGDYDWTHVGDGMYKIEIPASGGASINNDTEGVGYFTGICTGVLAWRSPDILFRAAALNDALVDGGDNLDVNVTQISGDSTAADNLELQYDTTGLTGDTFPATQAQVGNISVGAGGLSVDADSFTLTTGTESSGTVASTEELDGVVHTIVPSASVIDCYYEFDVGTNGLATEALWDGYVGNNSDNVEAYGYDWVSTSYKQIGSIAGKSANTNEEKAFVLTTAMTGTGANVGKVRVQFKSDGADVAVDLNTDRILCEYTSVASERLILHTGLAQAGATNTVTLDSGANATDDYYNHARVLVAGGTGSEQERIIVDYNGTTKVATIAPPWITQPDTTSVLEILPGTVHAETNSKTVKVGLAQTATSSTITLSTDASSVDDFYNDDALIIDAGTGIGQERIITDYNGTTKVATISPDWVTTPDTTSEYIVEEALTVTGKIETNVVTADALATDAAEEVADTVWDEAISGHNSAGTFGRGFRQLKESNISIESSVNDVSATTTSFVTNLTEATDDHYNDSTLIFVSGALTGQGKVITDYNGTSKTVSFDEAFTEAPADTDEFIIKTDHVHPVAQIQSGLATASALTTAQNDLDILTGTDGVLLDSTNDVYHALIEYTFDDPVDEYTVTWFKNGQRVTSGVTSPTIQIIKRADGTDLVGATAMTQIGSTASYKYDESTNVILADEAYLAVTAATIDSGPRSFACLVRRSS